MFKKIISTKFTRLAALAYLFLVLLAFHSCRKQEHKQQEGILEFTPTIVGQINTRATGTSWDQDDEIGVYMIKSGQPLGTNSIVDQVDNAVFKYLDVVFKSKSPIQMPNEKVDFIAYYPYGSVVNYQYAIDLKDQSNPSKLDFMYADNAKGMSQSQNNIPLRFERQLSQIAIKLTVTNGNQLAFKDLKASMPAVSVQGGFDLVTGAMDNDVVNKIDIDGALVDQKDGTALVSFMLFPGEDISDKKVRFLSTSGDSFTWKIPKMAALEKGIRYTFNVKLNNGKGEEEPVVTQPYFEIPRMTSLSNDEQFIQHFLPDDKGRRNYSMLYDKVKKMAYWVAYPMHSTYMGSAKRTDAWQYDPSISSSFQPDLFKGFGTNGYDRGHQLASADRNFNSTQNRTTFYFTNMTAQVSKLNQGIWANLEVKVRTWTAQCDTLYVVTGAIPTTVEKPGISYIDDNNRKKVAIPQYYFKALAKKVGSNYYTIAYKMNNEIPVSSKFDDYRMTVAELEKLTGFTFFPDLKAEIKETIEDARWK